MADIPDLQARIYKRARQLWEEAGRPVGSDRHPALTVKYWVQARDEIWAADHRDEC